MSFSDVRTHEYFPHESVIVFQEIKYCIKSVTILIKLLSQMTATKGISDVEVIVPKETNVKLNLHKK